ncbi:MAG: [protein-PII] uridylyltransferase [Alphaproteobacteria bacterium]|nr:[protein-PII] uridylyltransferase [Alphaproteobacteria bacterium]
MKFELLKARFLKSGNRYDSGLKIQSDYTDLIDETVSVLAEFCFREAKASPIPAIVALGGYGRKELAPYSDIDIVFVQEPPFSRQTKKFIESLSARFWNLGIKLSASARTLQECEKDMSEDVLFLTSLLEKRWIWGSKPAYQQLEKSFQRHIAASPPGFFVSAKLAERDARHQKMGDSRYQLEPNVKEGKGALRDIHTLLWIANFLYGIRRPEDMVRHDILTKAETATLKKALDFFWTVRCHLHFLAGRADDRLSFDSQPRIAELMGYKDAEPNVRAEKFMKDYFLLAKEVGHLTRILCAKVETQSLSGGATAGAKKMVLQDSIEKFPVKGNRLTVENANYFKKFPPEIVRIFKVSQATGLDIHSDALRHIRNAIGKLAPELQRSAEAQRLFLDILLHAKKAEQTLRRMNEADVLGALIPAFNNIVAHMQYDMYHVFTADEHTIRAVGMLHKLEKGELAEAAPLASALFPKIHSRRALYAAMFLHDIAKGTDGKHSETGAQLARELCPRFGLTPEETETVSWLVHEHLAMSMTATKRDLNDPKTIQDFAAAVQSPERLKLLTILTTADIMAVGPERWNNWKAGLLAELYHKAEAVMSGTELPPQALPPKGENWGEGKTVIKITLQPKLDYTEAIISTPDRKGLFATLSGAMAASGASIVDARIFTLKNGMAMDVFQIQDLKGHVYENTAFLNKTIHAALNGKIDLAAEIRERQKSAPRKDSLFKVASRVIIDNDASASNTVIEINGKDRPGFLYDITSALSREGLQISAAKISTFGSRTVDVFYVRDSFGLKILHPDKLQTIENNLKQVLEMGL